MSQGLDDSELIIVKVVTVCKLCKYDISFIQIYDISRAVYMRIREAALTPRRMPVGK
jgi:hypothetical protein